jgi:hypothetical protein
MTQNELILKYLKEGNKITPFEALDKFQCMRLSSRIWDLKQLGHNIKSESYKTPSGKKVERYWMENILKNIEINIIEKNNNYCWNF